MGCSEYNTHISLVLYTSQMPELLRRFKRNFSTKAVTFRGKYFFRAFFGYLFGFFGY